MLSVSLVKEKNIKIEVSCSNWKEVAQEVGNILVKDNIVEYEYIDLTIQSIVEHGPYVLLVPGIAFFHTNPNKYVNETGLSFITLEKPVYFNEDEKKKKINCAFAFAAVDSDSHLELLTKLADILRDKNLINILKNHPTKDEVIDIFKKI